MDMEPVSLKNQLYEASSSLPNKLYKNHSYLEEHFSDALTPAEADVIHSRFTSGLDMVDEIQEAQDTIIEEWRSIYLLPYKHVPFRFHLQGFLPRGEELNPHTIALVWKWTGRKGLNDCDEWRELLAEAEKFIREVKERGSKEVSRWEPVTSTTLQHRRSYAFIEY
jgi:predicted metal-dependent hydrolase